MLPRIAFLLQLRGKYHRATRDYMHLSRALDETQLSPTTRSVLGAGAGVNSLSRKRAAGDQGGLNSLDDDGNGRHEGDYDDLAHGRRLGVGNGRFQGGGGQRTQEEEEELRTIRSEEYEKRKEIKEIVKGIRAQILFRKIPLTLSRIERLLAPMRRPNKAPQAANASGHKRKLKKTKKTKKLLVEASGPAAHQSIVHASPAVVRTNSSGNLNPNPNTVNNSETNKLSADDEDMLDMMFMGFEDSVGVCEGLIANNDDTALVASNQATAAARIENDSGNTIEKEDSREEEGAADDFLFAGESTNGLSSSLGENGVKKRVPPTQAMKRRTTLQQHVSLANVTRFLDTLGYFEGQRELFLSQQMAEYSKAKSEINNQIHMRHRRLAKEHNKSTKGIVHTMRMSLKQVVAADAKMAGLKKQLADVKEKEGVLNASLIARPYTSARLWMAVLRFPALPSEGGPNREVDPSLRVPYARALAKMLSGIMRVIAKNGSGNAINEESPRFVATLSPSSLSKSKKMIFEGRSGVEGGWARHCEDVSKQHPDQEGRIMGNEAAKAIEMLIESPTSLLSDAVVVAKASNAQNTELVTVEKSSDKIAGWIPSPSRSATELLLLSLVRLAKVFEAIADDCKLLQQGARDNDGVEGEGPQQEGRYKGIPLASAAAAVHLSETLVRCQKIATGLLVAVNDTIKAREEQGIKFDAHTQEVLCLVGPTLATLDKSMTELGAAVVASFLPPTGTTSGMIAAAATTSALVPNAAHHTSISLSSVSSSAYLNMFAHQNFIESLKPQSALLLISRLYQLKCFHPDTPKESRKLLYALIQKGFPQATNRTRNTLIREGNIEDLRNFISDEQKAVMRRKGMSYRDILDNPVKEAKLQQKRRDALLKSKRLEELEQAQAEMIAIGVPLNDLLQAYECLSFAAMSAGMGALQASREGAGRGLDSPINTRAFKPVSKEAMSWGEMLGFAVPHLAEAIITRAAADKQLAIKMSEEDRASASPSAESTTKSAAEFAAGLNMLQLLKLLKLSSPLLDKMKAESHRENNMHQRRSGSSSGGIDSSSTAFYLFALSELKVKLSARLHQEVAKREAKERSMNVHTNKSNSAANKNRNNNNINNNNNKRLESADDVLLRSIDEEYALASGNTVPPLSPYVFAGIVNVTGKIMRGIRHATSPAVHNAARDLQQICKAMLIEDDELLNALRPLVREDNGVLAPSSRSDETSTSAPSRGHHHSDVYASIIDGFEMSKTLTPEFHSYLTNVL